ncbi:MAG: fatty acid metabolism transcriptional regulator FadR [Anaerolineae bacterium]|nr:fatty acid metabolism transcriptional regulator FadR [Anaerolineae bacterium]
MTNWSAPQRPAAYAEQALIEAILDGSYTSGSTLPGERDLAAQLGVTRPTLREALQRMERDGWVTIQQGKPTTVRDIWTEGGLNILSSLVHSENQPPFNLVPRLLEVRLVMAPAYARAAVVCGARKSLEEFLSNYVNLEDSPEAYTTFDWNLHHKLTVESSNPIYTLILNGFEKLYMQMGQIYFERPKARSFSREFYTQLLEVIKAGDADAAETITRRVMAESLCLWQQAINEPESETRIIRDAS